MTTTKLLRDSCAILRQQQVQRHTYFRLGRLSLKISNIFLKFLLSQNWSKYLPIIRSCSEKMRRTVYEPRHIQIDNSSSKVGNPKRHDGTFTPCENWKNCGQSESENGVKNFVVPVGKKTLLNCSN